MKYGQDDEYAIGVTHYGSDVSDEAKVVNRELNKLLKKMAHKGLFSCGPIKVFLSNYYWTDAAAESKKNWIRFLGKGEQKELNKLPGYSPKTA